MDCDEGNGADTNRNVRRNNEPSEGSRYTSRQNHMSKQNEVSHGSSHTSKENEVSHTSKQNEVSHGSRHSSNLNGDDETFSEVHDPLLEWKKANRPNEHCHSKLSNESNNRINHENSRTSDINHENSRTSNENKSKLSHESRTRSESRNKSSDQCPITNNPIQNGVDRSISYSLHEERENSRSHTETPERSNRENSRIKTNTRGHLETPERFGNEDFRASHFVNDSGNTRSRNTTKHDSDRIESFSDAAINQFPSVHSSGAERESQDTTMMNCYTPLNPEKLKIVFRHCLERGGGEEEEGVRGKVLVYNSDDEES
ncbi:GATOR complex protein WDR24-like isoform X1 [Diaphorina citri]|uniref:GATOR complex protein WDR24-like isoform X1 n=1 Tax=Diaphorina citri TaxID=121845 RepID=A0A3Q0IZ04_DIACI|nr:GATOR complex protein WDR24-like isoform X1 [Diaphorina citri]